MNAASENPAPLLRMSNIARRFGTTAALADVSLEVGRGEVHALVGENGAGKSTLMKILAGAEIADSGEIEFAGRPFAPRRPLDSLGAGIAMIYQEFNLAPHLSVEANLLLGRERRVGGLLLASRLGSGERNACRAAMERLNLRIPLDARVSELGLADQQMVEIARALMSGARLIIMDEPTSALAAGEVQRLFAIIRQLRSQGISVVYISHFLEELEQVADRLTVIRDGRTVASGAVGQFSRNDIIRAMVGRDVSEMYPRVPHELGEPLLTADHLAGRGDLPLDASFTLHRGEILGIAGLVGAGRTQTLRTLFGLDPRGGGTASINGVTLQHFSPRDWNRRGAGMLSEDRKAEGLAQSLSCLSNMTLPALRLACRFGLVSRPAQRRDVTRVGQSLSIRWSSPDAPVSSLSGGNQQKVALARLLYTDADVLLLDEPTRGIDVGAKVDLYRAIGQLAARGKAVVMVSSYLPELLGVCDRIAVMSRGVLSPAYDVRELTPEKVMSLAVGGSAAVGVSP
jgi:ribose transport system ATP-binding protein